MKTRALFPGGPPVSLLGLRLVAPPMAPWPRFGERCLYEVRRLSEEPTAAMIRAAAAAGITLFDSDWASGNGHAEEILGRVLRETGVDCLLSTKGGPRFDFAGRLIHDNSRSNLMNQCEDSRQRLGRQQIDLYSVQGQDDSVELKLTARGLNDLVHGGRVRALGVADFSPLAVEELMRYAPIQVIQAPINLLERSSIQAWHQLCSRCGLGLIATDPLAKGLLSGTFNGSETFPEIDPQRAGPLFQPPKFERAAGFSASLADFAQARGLTREVVALAWVLALPGVTSVFIEPRNEQELRSWLAAADLELTESDRHLIVKMLEEQGL